MDSSTKVKVRCRNGGRLVYFIEDSNIRRSFNFGEVKEIPFGELQALQWEPGGDYMLKHSLIIEDKEALAELGYIVEPEYYYTEDEVKKLLLEGSLDQLEDTLNFAPNGVIELIESIGVKIELPDVRKRKLIFDKTGFNIDAAIGINNILNDNSEESESEKEAVTRKAAPIEVSDKPKRKVTIIKKDGE